MELSELLAKSKEIFGFNDVTEFKDKIMLALSDENKLDAFCEAIGGDMSKDHLQVVYQYSFARQNETT